MRNCTFYIDFFPSEIQKIFSFLLLWLWLLIAKRACMQKIYLVIFEQLFLAKLSLTSFLNQLVHYLFSTSCWLLSILTSSCDKKKETFGTKKEYPLLHLKMHCSTTITTRISLAAEGKKSHAISSEAFFNLPWCHPLSHNQSVQPTRVLRLSALQV